MENRKIEKYYYIRSPLFIKNCLYKGDVIEEKSIITRIERAIFNPKAHPEKEKMETSNEGKFPETSRNYASVLFSKGSIAGKDVIIAISPAEDKKYITPKIAN